MLRISQYTEFLFFGKKTSATKVTEVHMTRPISRILSSTAIYLDFPSPESSSRRYFISAEQTLRYKAPIDVASGRVYIAVQSPVLWCALTAPFHHHHRSGSIFLLHLPESRLWLPLAVTLLCDVRTFLVN